MSKAASSKRDNFLASVRHDLAKRVAHRCSLCDAQTIGPKGKGTGSYDTGRAAHIKAAAAGGPRYDENQTPEERRSFENGIWCCATCADKIDSDHSSYSVEFLLAEKAAAEKRSDARVGKSANDASRVPSTLSGINRAIRRYCLDEEDRLEELDPRFHASVTYAVSGPVCTLTARQEAVPITIRLSPSTSKATREAIRDVFGFGGSRSFENIAIRFEGSPLFAELDDVLQRVAISTKTKPLTMTMTLGSERGTSMYFDFSGEVGFGAKGWRFRGQALDGLLGLEVTKELASERNGFRMDFDFESWGGKSLKRLPHFARILQLAREMARGTVVRLHVAVDGTESVVGNGMLRREEFPLQIEALLERVAILRRLDAFYALGAPMPDAVYDVLQYDEDYDDALAVVDIHDDDDAEVRHRFFVTEPVSALQKIFEEQKPGLIELRHTLQFSLLGSHCGPFEVLVSCESGVIGLVGPANLVAEAMVECTMRAVSGVRWKSRCVSSPDADSSQNRLATH